MKAFRTILAKDLRVELRSMRSLAPMALFAATAFVTFRFALDRSSLSGGLAAGVLVSTLLLASLLAIGRSFLPERDEGGLDSIRLAPVGAGALYAAKASALFCLLLILEIVAAALFWLFFLDSGSGLPAMLGVLALMLLGVAAVGTLVSTIAVMSGARELLVPLLALPLAVPLVIAAAGAGSSLLAAGGPDYEGIGTWLGLLGLYDGVFLAVGYAIFEFLIDD